MKSSRLGSPPPPHPTAGPATIFAPLSFHSLARNGTLPFPRAFSNEASKSPGRNFAVVSGVPGLDPAVARRWGSLVPGDSISAAERASSPSACARKRTVARSSAPAQFSSCRGGGRPAPGVSPTAPSIGRISLEARNKTNCGSAKGRESGKFSRTGVQCKRLQCFYTHEVRGRY